MFVDWMSELKGCLDGSAYPLPHPHTEEWTAHRGWGAGLVGKSPVTAQAWRPEFSPSESTKKSIINL